MTDAAPVGALQLVPLSVGEVQVVDVAGEPYVVLSPVLRALGLSVEGQTQRLRRQPWAARTCVTHVVQAADGLPRPATVVAVQTFLMLMATIDSTRVAPEARERVVAYQCETAEAIGRYWSGTGIAVNPRGRSATEVALMENGPAVLEALGHLQRAHYYDQMTAPPSDGIGRRDLEPGLTMADARRLARKAYQRGYAALVGPVLRLAPELRRDLE